MNTNLKEIKYLRSLFQSNKDNEIIRLSSDLLSKYSNNLEILNLIGAVFIRNNNFEDAIEVFTKIFKINPNQPNISMNLGNLYRLTSNNDEALKHLNAAIKLDPDNFYAFYNLALTYQSKMDFSLAQTNYDLALNKIPADQEAHFNLVGESFLRFLIAGGKIEEALLISKKFLSKYPDSPKFLHVAGNLNSRLNEIPESIDCYRRALLIDRDNQSVKFDLCFALKKTGKLKEAASILKNLNYKDSRAFYIECLFTLTSKEEFYKELNEACKNYKGNRLLANLSKYASIKYKSEDNYPFCNKPFDFIYKANIMNSDSSKKLIKAIDSLELDFTEQDLLVLGNQSSGNLFNHNNEFINQLKNTIEKQIDSYRSEFSNADQYFLKNWPEKANLVSWYINIREGGSLDYHFHHAGWVSGTVYLSIPDTKIESEGAIEFGFNNANYEYIEGYPTEIVKPNTGDIVIFPSSLNHRVKPFSGGKKDERRISLAFDLVPINK